MLKRHGPIHKRYGVHDSLSWCLVNSVRPWREGHEVWLARMGGRHAGLSSVLVTVASNILTAN